MQAANFQTIVTPDGRIPLDNLTISPNRTDAAVYEIRPFYKQPVGTAEFYVEAGYLNVAYDEERIQSSEEKYAYTSLGNVTRQEGVAWQVDYRYRLTEYDQPPEWEFQRAAMSLGYWFKGRLRIFGVGGVETSFDNFLEPNLDADFWEAGFQYSPGSRLNLELAVGERSYGDSFRGDLYYKMKRGEISASYSETPTSRAEILYNRRPLEDNQAPDFVLDSLDLSDRFVLKRGDVTLNMELSRSILTFNAFTENRENVSTAEGEELEDEHLVGGSAGWKFRIGSRTTLSATGYFVSREAQRTLATTEPVLYDDELTRGILGVAYDLLSWLNVRVEHVRSKQDGATPGEGYDETQYRIIFTGKL